MITLYGIKNCDTVKKARKWLESNGIDYRFHDFREDGMGDVPLQQWLEEFGWEQVLNRRSTSWRALEETQKNAMDNNAALAAARATPTLIKRPVTACGDRTIFGFREAAFKELAN
ncbi:ArsC family reductase [Microbulbifer yueqingensis]|uniref:Transcriptional regulator, Spx/MgsR family n=1 Tax=Microbulbifer yueqingensis TaxID=658219 RepID=A0A1G8UYQ6_9GAMM|nr:ArsC family reductase [Microbulbifer yueqingensis]SDJ58080.1 transcriptional regulator, Spx/MgsR family [Microbulbifer yueqingensis]